MNGNKAIFIVKEAMCWSLTKFSRFKGILTGTLLRKLIHYAKRANIDRIYTTINRDNEASIKLHLKAGFNVRSGEVASCRMGALGLRVFVCTITKQISLET